MIPYSLSLNKDVKQMWDRKRQNLSNFCLENVIWCHVLSWMNLISIFHMPTLFNLASSPLSLSLPSAFAVSIRRSSLTGVFGGSHASWIHHLCLHKNVGAIALRKSTTAIMFNKINDATRVGVKFLVCLGCMLWVCWCLMWATIVLRKNTDVEKYCSYNVQQDKQYNRGGG